MEGYGIYWFLIEQLANAGGKLPLELIPVLTMQMQSTDVKVNGVVHNFGLFTIEHDEFWSERLQEHLELRNRLSEGGKNGAANRWANRGAIGGANAKERKEKEIKGKEIKEKKVKESKVLTLFSESIYNDIKIFEASFLGTQYEGANFTYYHEVIKNWSDSTGNKKRDWIATAKNWMAKDMTKGTFIDKNYKPNANNQTKSRVIHATEEQFVQTAFKRNGGW
jgi:hypothetical protein